MPLEHAYSGPLEASRSRARGAVTIVVLLLVYAAFDDITTDSATSFRVEYSALIACAAWLVFLAVRLITDGRAVLGAVSLAAIGAAAWGQRRIGPGIVPGLWPEYVATTAAYLWFWPLALWMAAGGAREHRRERS